VINSNYFTEFKLRDSLVLLDPAACISKAFFAFLMKAGGSVGFSVKFQPANIDFRKSRDLWQFVSR